MPSLGGFVVGLLACLGMILLAMVLPQNLTVFGSALSVDTVDYIRLFFFFLGLAALFLGAISK